MSEYEIELKCQNCGETRLLHIPKGMTVDEVIAGNKTKIEKIICPSCGCLAFPEGAEKSVAR
jgi:ribosomal protein S27AE